MATSGNAFGSFTPSLPAAVTQLGNSTNVANGLIVLDTTGNNPVNKIIVPKTTNYTLLSTDSNKVFTNAGAAGTIVLTLPTAVSGILYNGLTTTAQILRFQAPAGVTITVAGTSSTSGGTLSSAAVTGSSITLIAASSTQWFGFGGGYGTWTAA